MEMLNKERNKNMESLKNFWNNHKGAIIGVAIAIQVLFAVNRYIPIDRVLTVPSETL